MLSSTVFYYGTPKLREGGAIAQCYKSFYIVMCIARQRTDKHLATEYTHTTRGGMFIVRCSATVSLM
jgi:hypothetical protein